MSRCIKCQIELSPADIELGRCPKCRTQVMQGTVEIPDAPDYSQDEPMVIPTQSDLSSASGISGLGPNTADVPQPSIDDSKATMPSPKATADAFSKANKASVPAAPALSVEDIFKDTNTRQSINPENFPRNQRNIVTSLMLGGSAHAVTEDFTDSVDGFDTSLDEPIISPMDRSIDTASLPRSREISVFEGRERGPDDESLSSWQGKSGLGAESNLVIQQRSVLTSPDEPQGPVRSDYQLVDLIGKGGMGTVWKARQYSIGRTVAVKMIRAEKAHDKEARERFLSEAVITGDLDHPNIVPVHDLGKFESNELFYSMRRVGGQPWDKVMFEKTLAENLEIWNKVCDAIAFAHSRGIVHRDIKPENVMVGEYGEVLVMDWGLAMPLPNFPKYTMIMPPTRSGGSPAYMAPEMVGLLLDQVGPWSDIYLLGATLYEIVTGNPPHPGRTVSECVSNAKNNVIQPFAQGGKKSELVNISLKAMATKPDDRYGSVLELQAAVKRYAEHQESLTLAENASVAVARGQEFKEYKEFARAVFGYEEALNRWDGNKTAHEGLNQARITYAETALANHDYDLGLSLLDVKNAQHAPVIQKLKAGKNEREARANHIKRQQRMLAALALIIGIGGLGAGGFFYFQNNQLNIAKTNLEESNKQLNTAKTNLEQSNKDLAASVQKEQKATQDAKIAQGVAETAQGVAEKALADLKVEQMKVVAQAMELKTTNENLVVANEKEKKATMDAVAAKMEAEDNAKKAKAAQEKAEASELAERETKFNAVLQLVQAQLNENNFGSALQNLEALKADKRYEQLVTDTYKKEFDQRYAEAERRNFAVAGDTALQAVAVAPGGAMFASGSRDGFVQFWTVDLTKERKNPQALDAPVPFRTLAGSPAAVTGLSFSQDGKRLAISGDSVAVRVLNVGDRQEERVLKHKDFVHAVAFSPDGQLVTGTSEGLRLWDLASMDEPALISAHDGTVLSMAFSQDGKVLLTGGSDNRVIVWSREGKTLRKKAEFFGTETAVNAVAVSADGKRAASAGEDGWVLAWNVQDAVAKWEEAQARDKTRYPGKLSVPFVRLGQHQAAVASLAFSPGGALLSGSQDNTLMYWGVGQTEKKSIAGHGNSVNDVSFLTESQLVSVSSDSTIRVWDRPKAGTPTAGSPAFQGVGKADTRSHEDEISAVSLDPAGEKTVTAALDRTAILWNTVTGERLQVFKEGHDFLADRAYLVDGGKTLVTVAQDQSLCLWDLARGVERQRIQGSGFGNSVAVSPDGTLLVTGSEEDELLVWSIDALLKAPKGTARPQARIPLEVEIGFTAGAVAAAFSADGTRVAVATTQDNVVVCDLAARKVIASSDRLIQALGDDVDDLVGVAFLSPTDIVAATTEGVAQVWNTAERKANKTLVHPQDVIADVESPEKWFLIGLSLSGDGRWLATLGGKRTMDQDQVTLWDVQQILAQDRPQPARTLGLGSREMLGRPLGRMTAVSLSHDGQTLITASSPDATDRKAGDAAANESKLQRVFKWSVTGTGDPQELPLTDKDVGIALGVLSTPRGVVTIGGNEARLWSWGDQPQVDQVFRPNGMLTAAALSQDGKTVATGDLSGVIKVWDAATGLCLYRTQAHAEPVTSLMFSPAPETLNLLVSASDDSTAVVWNWNAAQVALARTGSLDDAQNGHAGPVTRARFSKDSKSIVTASEDGKVRVWDAAARTLVAGPFAIDNPVVSADILPDSSMIASADATGVRVIDVKTGKPVLSRPISGHGRDVTDVRFLDYVPAKGESPARVRVLTTSLDGTGKIWDVASGESTELLTLGQRGKTTGVTGLAATPDGSAIVTGHTNGRRSIWRAPAPQQ